jgi:hypothetical protein
MLTSAVCLALLLAAFVISRETTYIHGRCIACQAFSLLIGFVAKGVDNISDFHRNNFMCYGIGKFLELLNQQALFRIGFIILQRTWATFS